MPRDPKYPEGFTQAVEAREKQERIDAFAAAAMTGLLVTPVATDAVAAIAYRIAEDMERERSRRMGGK